MSIRDPRSEGRLLPSEVDFLRGEQPYLQRVERRRPGWMVVGMVWATFGIYLVFWLGINWAEMKRELRDDRMYPIWHALAMLVPIYSFFRFHSNFRVMNELLAQTNSRHRVRPFLAVATFLAAAALVSVPVSDIVLITLNQITAVAVISWVIHHGQTGMNAYWDAKVERKTTSEVKVWERLLIGFGVVMWFLIILAVLIEGDRL